MLRDQAANSRSKAEESKDPQDVRRWRQDIAILRREINTAKRDSFNKFISGIDYRRDGKRVFKFVNKIKGNLPKKPREPMDIGGRILHYDKDISNAFVKFYSKNQRLELDLRRKQKIMRRMIDESHRTARNVHQIFVKNFNLLELQEAIKCLKNGKSPGPDNIHPEFVKHFGNNTLVALLDIFNLSWNTVVPAEWKKAFIVPILKKDKPPDSVTSYRPIALTSVLSKVIERMIISRLNWFLESNNLLSPRQAGFRRHHSTVQQVSFLTQAIKDSLDERKSVLATFVDFESAYDRVWRLRSLQKLQFLGICGNMFTWIKNFVSQRFSAVRYGEAVSKFRQTETGLPQGTVISPILFNIFINDLVDFLSPVVESALFADDLVMWGSAEKKHQDNLNGTLNAALMKLDLWCQENGMKVNRNKTVCQFFTLNRRPFTPTLEFRGETLRTSDSTTYLGCVLDSRLNWRKHAEHLKTKAEKRLPILKRLAGSRWGCNRRTLNTTYKMFIQPLLVIATKSS
jgi:hypothetical protein